MNKERIGGFLKALRKEKNLTQLQLSNALGGDYSDAFISKWERGESVPNIQDLKRLAEYYNVSVDEILNGARYEEVALEEKYFIWNSNWMSRYNPDDLYNKREEQEVLIEARFKELLKKMVSEGLSLLEDKEFDFIVNHFYRIFLPAIEWKGNASYRNDMIGKCASLEDIDNWFHDILPGGLADIKFEIYSQIAFRSNATIEEKFWEANKKFVFVAHQNIRADINDAIEDNEDAVRYRISQIEDYEKDILLATLQRVNVENTLAVGGPRGRELYEKRYGRRYDEEQLTKQAIKLLIECGAKLNKNLLGYWKVVTWEHPIIDKLEELHKKYKSPILVPICENGRYNYFIVDNTKHNREQLGIKCEREAFDESDYSELEQRLYAGEKKILKPYKCWVCDDNEQGVYLHACEQMLDLSLEAYMESRDDKATKELLEDLDVLSLDAIRVKYFPEEYNGEYIDDKQTMSDEEFKQKYYIKGVPNE